MDTAKKSSNARKLEADREIIRQSLDEIAAEFGSALRDADLHYAAYLTVPHSEDALAAFATPVDPSNDDWSHMSVILRQIIGKELGGVTLRRRDLPCAPVNVSMAAADLTVD